MGAWGINNLENDSALDWIADFAEKQSIDKIEGLFTDAIEEDEPDVDLGSAVLAAAELLAIAQGNEPEDYDNGIFEDHEIDLENIQEWLDADLINLTLIAVGKISEGTDSELRILWEEAGELDHWLHVVEDLKKRVKA